MYFKSLELIGFKSFAEKTKLNFEPGVTAIVGPNGTGKSNVADAIRWVLGEQSAKSLRASNMQDVIFNGTDSKEPINYAEVSLTFSNEKRLLPIDYDEVTITRRVFRSGDTEYLLNKTPVRLKDISELLMGTGIGTESYSIIEQGKMDLILSSRPEDRRYVFEEASGITKYKSKKKEALKKLEQTEQNLLRISDIIQEVKRQISSIERQARKAERYKVDFDKLKEIEVKVSFYDFKGLKTEEKTFLIESEDLKNRERELDAEVKHISSNVSNYRQSLDAVSQKYSELKGSYSGMSSALEMNIHKISIDEERIAEARLSQETLSKEISSINEKVSSAKAFVEKLKTDLSGIVSEREAKQRLMAEKESLLERLAKEIDETEEKVKISKARTVDYLARETKIKNDLIKLGADVGNRKARERRLGIEKETVEKELDSVTKIWESTAVEFADAEKRLLTLKADRDSKSGSVKTILSEVESLDSRIMQEEKSKAGIKSKVEFLDDLIKKREGFHQGVKSLLAAAESGGSAFGGVFGVLADIIKIERGYEEAVNIFLGDDAQTIITEKDSDIANAIEYLRHNRLGKANFISLETLRRLKLKCPRNLNEEGLPEALKPLKAFVSFESKHEDVIDHFFGDAYLAEPADGTIPKDINRLQSYAFVTRTGIKYDNGKFSGGSVSENSDSFLIGRRDRLEALKTELKTLEDMITSLGLAREEKSSLAESLKLDMRSLEEALHAEDIAFSGIRVKKDGHEEGMKKLKDELLVVDLELEEARQAIDELVKKGEVLNAELNNLEKEASELNLFINTSQVAISDRRAQKEKLAPEIATLKTEIQSRDREEESGKNNLQKEETALFELEDTQISKEDLLKDFIEKVKGFTEEIANLKAQDEGISEDLKALKKEISEIESGKTALVDRLGMAEAELKDKEAMLESLRNQIRDSDVKLTGLNYKKTGLKERILQAYKTDLENIHIEVEDNADWESLRSQIAELKDRLEKMGPVNLVAIDEHKELEERNAFLIHQQEDLVNAKDSLLKAIQKINKTTKELFLDTFQKIQVEFKTLFRTLFGGGQAELVLIDDSDILESGIEIIVRPPGKKLQNLMLLSGGEKALTAIALLFSIFKVKPSPFCVLDEIDAPLDESNVNRFSNALKDFLKISQFIIITHNKRTIELADVMYGITMQERGVSKIVSVKFLDDRRREAKDEPSNPVAA